MHTRPTGTVTFLFTDVAGSTRLWDTDRKGMAASLAAHDRIMQSAITKHSGFVFSTAGDSFAAAFPHADAALEAAVEAQLALNAERWLGPAIQVRMGVHTGASHERASNYFGPEVNRAARIMSAANGGQVLVSGVTAQLMASTDPGYELVDRGLHGLKDLARPAHLFELRHPRLPEVKDPLRTADPERNHLPAQLTPFVGRRAELEAVTDLLQSARLVTLTGVGGTGKTRLSMEAANLVQDRFPDGVWMAELAPISDPDLVISEIAELWGLRPGEGVELVRVVGSYLGSRHLLLVIDNCEHVLETAASAIAELLSAAPELEILATSRESLGVPGEAVYRVPSLGVPEGGSDPADSDAVRLFMDRADRAGRGVSPSEMDAVVRICRRLDGIPLGIELAVARLRTLSPTELADRLEDSFRILAGGSKVAVPRQRTLQTAIDWSYQLLDTDEASLFRRLSVFAGGFDLRAAEATGAGGEVEEWQILGLIDQLIDKSLLDTIPASQPMRFRMLEPIRQYGQERLAAAGEGQNAYLTHARHYADYVSDVAPRLRGPDQRQANDDLMAEVDNIRLALASLLEHADFDQFLETCFHLTFFWGQSGLLVEGREIVLSGLESADDAASPGQVARGWFVASMLATYLTDPKTVEYADRGLEAARATGDEALVGWLSAMRGTAHANLVGRKNNQHWFDEAKTLIEANPGRPMWDPEWDQIMLEFLLAFGRSGSDEEQRSHIIETVTRARALGDDYIAAMAMAVASYVGKGSDDWTLGMLRDSVQMLRELDFRHGLGHSLFYLGAKMQETGIGTGSYELREGSALLAEIGDLPCSTWSAALLIRSLIASGDLEEAGEALVTAVDRLLAFERHVSSDLPALACRLATLRGDHAVAARLLGHIWAQEEQSTEDIDSCRVAVEEEIPKEERELLLAEGEAADEDRILEWMRAAGTQHEAGVGTV